MVVRLYTRPGVSATLRTVFAVASVLSHTWQTFVTARAITGGVLCTTALKNRSKCAVSVPGGVFASAVPSCTTVPCRYCQIDV